MNGAVEHEAVGTEAEPAGASHSLLVGLDLGTNKSCIQAAADPNGDVVCNRVIPSVVGYVKDGIMDSVLPDDARVLFGEEALRHRLHLSLVWPLKEGIVDNVAAAKDYARFLRTHVSRNGHHIRAVIGIPANADVAARRRLREALAGVFDRVLLVPEPFLAALGYRDPARLNTPGYVDPVRNSLFVDIGAGTTDLCLVQGCLPAAEDQMSFAFAGNNADDCLHRAIQRTYPDCILTRIRVREIKEKLSFVGEPEGPLQEVVIVGGRKRTLDLTAQVREACEELLRRVAEAVMQMIARADADSVSDLLRNIVLTGGGSRIRQIAPELQRRLEREGFADPRVCTVGARYAELVAKGALLAARKAREDQWQHLMA